MYIPEHFRETDLAGLDWLAAHEAFGTLISSVQDAPFATHLPVLYIMTTSAFTPEEQSLWLVGLMAALGTFGASAVLATSAPPQQATNLLRTAALHIALAIVAAAFGLGLIHWVRSASG